jgi:hypothetical protein
MDEMKSGAINRGLDKKAHIDVIQTAPMPSSHYKANFT